MYEGLITTKQTAFEIVKLDATHFGKRTDPNRVVLHSVWTISECGEKSVYSLIFKKVLNVRRTGRQL